MVNDRNVDNTVVMKKVTLIYQIFFAVIILFLAAGCKKEEVAGDKEYKITHWPIVKASEATNITDSTATLNGTVYTYGLPTAVTIEYGTTTSYGSIVTAYQKPVSGDSIIEIRANISGLTLYTTYHFRVRAENCLWTNFYSSDKSFTIGQPPYVHTAKATNISAHSATLNGTVNAHGFPTTVTFIYIIGPRGARTVTAVQSPVTGDTDILVNADISFLVPELVYSFRIIATNTCGTVYGNLMPFTTNK